MGLGFSANAAYPSVFIVIFHFSMHPFIILDFVHSRLVVDCTCLTLVKISGACEGTLSCSTCHLIFKPDEMPKLNLDEPSDEELDMLDLAYGLEET